MNTSIIKIISFGIALCSIAGGSSLASTLNSNYNSQDRRTYDEQEFEISDFSQDADTPSSGSGPDPSADLTDASNSDLDDLDADLTDAPNAESVAVITDDPVDEFGDDLLEPIAEDDLTQVQYVSQSKHKAPIGEIIVGDF